MPGALGRRFLISASLFPGFQCICLMRRRIHMSIPSIAVGGMHPWKYAHHPASFCFRSSCTFLNPPLPLRSSVSARTARSLASFLGCALASHLRRGCPLRRFGPALVANVNPGSWEPLPALTIFVLALFTLRNSLASMNLATLSSTLSHALRFAAPCLQRPGSGLSPYRLSSCRAHQRKPGRLAPPGLLADQGILCKDAGGRDPGSAIRPGGSARS